jgi:hypothetical protein
VVQRLRRAYPCSYGHYCRLGSTAALLGTGSVLLADGLAGLYSNPSATATTLLYNPATNTWASTGSMLTARADQTESVLPDGQVLIAGAEGFASHVATSSAAPSSTLPSGGTRHAPARPRASVAGARLSRGR